MLAFALATPAQAAPRVEVWFEPTEHSSKLLGLAARVGSHHVYDPARLASQVCPRQDYLLRLRGTRIEWSDATRGQATPYAFVAEEEGGKGLLRMSVPAWKTARSDADRLRISVAAILEACSPGNDLIDEAAEELVQSLRRRLRSDGDESALQRLSQPSERPGLIQIPQSQVSLNGFEVDEDDGSAYLRSHLIQLGGGAAYSRGAGDEGSLNPVASLLSHGIVGRPAGEIGMGAMTYLARASVGGGSQPVYQMAIDGMAGFSYAVGVYVGVEAAKLKGWKTSELIANFGIGPSPILIRLDDRSYLLFQVAAGLSSWKTASLEPEFNTPSDAVSAVGAHASAIARFGDFLVTTGAHGLRTSTQADAATRANLHASVSIPVRLLSNGYLRLEASRTAVSGGKIETEVGGVFEPIEVPGTHHDSAGAFYEARF